MEIATSPTFRFQKWHHRINRWAIFLLCLCLILSIPLFSVLSSLLEPFSENWHHLYETVLFDYISNSFVLMLGVAIGTFIMGTSCAWLTTMCNFPGRKIFSWALLLPMAMPAYIIAYAYTGMLDFSGPVQTLIRDQFDLGYGDYWFPEIRSRGGAICMLSLVLYPYVYLITRASMLEQSHALLEVSRSLGKGPWQTFLFVALPAARPAIVAGMTLALMETLADYGTVQYFGVSTFTTGIFRTWFGMGDLSAAAQLSSLLLFFVASLIIIERWSRSRMRFHHATSTQKRLARIPLNKSTAFLCAFWCSVPLSLGFIVPAAQLISWAFQTWQTNFDETFLSLVANSFTLACLTSVSCLVLGLALCFSYRMSARFKYPALLIRASTLGYAVPGTVIAVGVLIPFAGIDNTIDQWARSELNVSTGLILSGTIFAVIFAYCVRFVSVSVQSIESGYSKIRHSVDDSARILGTSPSGLLGKIHVPMLKTSIITALLLVFVDVLKELPTTLILRPFNFNTLAVRAFELASDERLADASISALAIVAVGIIPVILLSRTMSHKQDTQ